MIMFCWLNSNMIFIALDSACGSPTCGNMKTLTTNEEITMTLTQTTNLTEAARKAAMKTKAGSKLTGEDIRTRVQSMGITAQSASAWGGTIQSLIRQGVLEKTDETRVMKSAQARGRKSPVYVRQAVRA